jgi:hypothetical protein
MFASLQDATDYLQNNLQDFYNQRGVLAGRLTAIAKLKDAAAQSNNQQALGQLIVLRQQVVDLLSDQMLLEDRLKPFAEYFGVSTWHPPVLGMLPLVLAGAAIAVAVALYLHYEKLQNQAKALDLVARGILPASEAESILNPSFFSGLGGSFAQVGILAVGGLFLFLYLTRR